MECLTRIFLKFHMNVSAQPQPTEAGVSRMRKLVIAYSNSWKYIGSYGEFAMTSGVYLV